MRKQRRRTAQLISAFVFAIRIVHSFYYLNSKYQASSLLLWLYSPVCVGPGRNPRRPVFSQRSSYYMYLGSEQQKNTDHTSRMRRLICACINKFSSIRVWFNMVDQLYFLYIYHVYRNKQTWCMQRDIYLSSQVYWFLIRFISGLIWL